MNLKLALITKLLSALIDSISPDVKKFILESIDKLDVKAQATKNPFDDILVKLLQSIFS